MSNQSTADKIKEELGKITFTPNGPEGKEVFEGNAKNLERFKKEVAEGTNEPLAWISADGDMCIDSIKLIEVLGNYPGALFKFMEHIGMTVAPFVHNQESRDSAFEELRENAGVTASNVKSLDEITAVYKKYDASLVIEDDLPPQLVSQDGSKLIH